MTRHNAFPHSRVLDSDVVPLKPALEMPPPKPPAHIVHSTPMMSTSPTSGTPASAVATAAAAVVATQAPATSDSKTLTEDDIVSELTINSVKVNLNLLFTTLSYRRAHGSAGERAWIQEVFVPEMNKTGAKWSWVGPATDMTMLNAVAVVPKADGSASETMFSCHIDTVHTAHDTGIRQRLNIDPNLEHVFLADADKSGNCLGADNGAGVWLLMEMIRFKVPGTYVFHRGEERGCLGSKWLAHNRADWAATYKRAVAFDRKDTYEVITTQRGNRTCSDKFAMELATSLSLHPDLTYRPSPNGMYTDTASYEGIIPECTNVGVGYEDAHGSSESLNYAHVQNLLAACVSLKWEELPTERDPKAKPAYSGYAGYSSYRGGHHNGHHGYHGQNAGLASPGRHYNGFNGFDHDDAETLHWAGSRGFPAPSAAPAPSPSSSAARNDGRGKSKNKNKGKPAHQQQAQPQLTSASIFDSMSMEDFDGLSFDEISMFCDEMTSGDAAIVISSLLEEIEALKARLEFARRQAGYSTP